MTQELRVKNAWISDNNAWITWWTRRNIAVFNFWRHAAVKYDVICHSYVPNIRTLFIDHHILIRCERRRTTKMISNRSCRCFLFFWGDHFRSFKYFGGGGMTHSLTLWVIQHVKAIFFVKVHKAPPSRLIIIVHHHHHQWPLPQATQAQAGLVSRFVRRVPLSSPSLPLYLLSDTQFSVIPYHAMCVVHCIFTNH